MVEPVKKRKYFLAANWKANGTTHFTKDIVMNLINSFDYKKEYLGTQHGFDSF